MDEVLLGKAAIIERCLQRIADEHVGHEDELATNLTRQAFEFLVSARILDAELGRKLVAMVGFRNIAVHNYGDIDILRGILAGRLDDLRAFAALLLRRALP